MFETPILFIVFNRPDVTRLVFNEIKKIKPKYLFIAADGPRKDKQNEQVLCEETRKIIDLVDWPCELKTLFRKENWGCGKAVSDAITWFFKSVEQGIILEDDCLPDQSFFNYCSDLLEKYKYDERIMHIGGVNFQKGIKRGDGSYYFSAISHVWGWATWRRAWNKYDFDVRALDTFRKSGKIHSYFNDKKIAARWIKTFTEMQNHSIDTWDHQWTFAVLNNNGMAIIPEKNLISNIGFGSGATHTHTADSVHANAVTTSITFPIQNPKVISVNNEADYFFLKDIEHWETEKRFSLYAIKYAMKNKVILFLEYFLRNYYFKHKVRKPYNNILILKTDAIGDYIIVRNLIKELVNSSTYKGYKFYMLANARLQSFIEQSDSQWFEKVIYLDTTVFSRFISKYRFFFLLRKYKFHSLIHPTYSRSVMTDDLVFYVGASNSIGFSGDCSNITEANKKQTDSYYTKLIDVDAIAGNEFTHEFEKQKHFFSVVSGNELKIPEPSLLDRINPSGKNSFCICPGASEEYKMWSTNGFAELIELLSEKYQEADFILLCGPGEEGKGSEIYGKLHEQSRQRSRVIGVKSVTDLVKVIAGSKLTVSNDSAPFHIAHALQIPAVCVFNGSKYGRFVPYPEKDQELEVVIPDALSKELELFPEKMQYYYRNISRYNISSISADKVFRNCNAMLNRK